MHRRVVLCVDFDGCLCQHEFPRIGQIIQPAFDTLIKLQQQIRTRLILWTCREPGQGLEEAVQFCHEHGLDFDTVNEGWALMDGFALHKVIADFYIDDRNIDWKDTKDEELRWECIYRRVWDYHCKINGLNSLNVTK